MRKLAWFMVGGGVALALGCGGGKSGAAAKPGTSVRSTCAKNLLRLNRSLLAYAADADDVLPREDWNDALAPYLYDYRTETTAVLRCPAVSGSGVGYAYNSALVGGLLNSIENRDATPAFFDVASLAANVVSAYPPAAASGRHAGDCVVYLSGRSVPEVSPDDPTPLTPRESCLNNLKALGGAAALYAADNDDRYPVADWTDAYTPYVAQTDRFRCPALPAGSYGYAYDPAQLGASLTTSTEPAATPVIFDATILTRNALSPYGANMATRHEGPNALFLDGHAASVTP